MPPLDPLVAGLPPLAPPPPTRPTAWNGPAFGLLAIFLVALGALLYPQYRARVVEHKANPMVAALANRPATARCPRYITSIFTNVGSVQLDANGAPTDRTDLTGPICEGVRRLFTPEGRAEMRCLVTDGRCPDTALRSVVAINVIAHEAMHLKGTLDEREAECQSIGESQRASELAGSTPEEGRMVGYVHLAAMNPNSPEQYVVSTQNCAAAADFEANPPGTPELRATLTASVERTWLTLGES